MHLWWYPCRILTCLVLTFYILKKKKRKKNLLTISYIPLFKVSMEHERKTFLQRKNRKSSLKICIHTYSHIEGRKLRKSFSHHRLDPILITHPYNLMCIKYANMSQLFFVTSKYFIDISRNLPVGGKGSLCENMKK